MSCRMPTVVCFTLILVKVQLCWSLDLIRTNHNRHNPFHRKLDYSWLAKNQYKLQMTNDPLFDEVIQSYTAKAQQKDKTPLPDNPEARMTSVNDNITSVV